VKGLFVHRSLEYRFEMPREDTLQGDVLPCTLSVKNHGAQPISLTDLQLDLVYGDLKTRAGEADDLAVVSTAPIALPWELAPHGQQSTLWECVLDRNCPVSEKTKSLAFRFGSSSGQLERLPLLVHPHADVRAVYLLLESSHQFVLGTTRFSKGWVETKFKPSSAPRFATVNELVLGTRFHEGALELRFAFKVKKFDVSSATSIGVSRGKEQNIQRIEESALHGPAGRRDEPILAALEAGLSEVATGF